MNGHVDILVMLIGDDGRDCGNLGTCSFPHVPQLGSHVLLHPPEPESSSLVDEEHVYEIVDIRYQFARPEDSESARRLFGWEIAVRHRGPHLDYRQK